VLPESLLQSGVELAVTDTGCGISADIMHQIFDPFFTTKPVDKGSGLGLAIISGLVHHAGGHIVVESDTIDGTTVRILLPTESQTPLTPSQPHALVVDDEPAVLQLLSMRLKRMGYTVDSFSNPMQALTAVDDDPQRFTLIISDYNMPEMNGIDLCFAIRALNPSVPIVMCSGLEIPLADLPIGCSTVFKPIDFDALSTLINTLV
jgi:CheY-like chemotaxis protein